MNVRCGLTPKLSCGRSAQYAAHPPTWVATRQAHNPMTPLSARQLQRSLESSRRWLISADSKAREEACSSSDDTSEQKRCLECVLELEHREQASWPDRLVKHFEMGIREVGELQAVHRQVAKNESDG